MVTQRACGCSSQRLQHCWQQSACAWEQRRACSSCCALVCGEPYLQLQAPAAGSSRASSLAEPCIHICKPQAEPLNHQVVPPLMPPATGPLSSPARQADYRPGQQPPACLGRPRQMDAELPLECYAYSPDRGSACGAPAGYACNPQHQYRTAPWAAAYSGEAPYAVYEQGQEVCVQWLRPGPAGECCLLRSRL